MRNRIKYCIWDIGKVIYNFTFAPLDVWCQSKTINLELYMQQRGLLDYDDYMKGGINFRQWCQRLCELYAIPFIESYVQEIDQALHQGVSPRFEVTLKLMNEIKKCGIDNCFLSNALPNLADTGEFGDLILPSHRFASYEIGLLKPDTAIYEFVRSSLNAEFAELVFIDDKAENVDAATKLGIHAILFNQATIEDNIHQILKECYN